MSHTGGQTGNGQVMCGEAEPWFDLNIGERPQRASKVHRRPSRGDRPLLKAIVPDPVRDWPRLVLLGPHKSNSSHQCAWDPPAAYIRIESSDLHQRNIMVVKKLREGLTLRESGEQSLSQASPQSGKKRGVQITTRIELPICFPVG